MAWFMCHLDSRKYQHFSSILMPKRNIQTHQIHLQSQSCEPHFLNFYSFLWFIYPKQKRIHFRKQQSQKEKSNNQNHFSVNQFHLVGPRQQTKIVLQSIKVKLDVSGKVIEVKLSDRDGETWNMGFFFFGEMSLGILCCIDFTMSLSKSPM